MKKTIIIIAALVLFVAMAFGISYISSDGPYEIVNQVSLNRSPEEVFDFCADMRNELTWNPDVQHMEKITEGDVGLWTKFKAKWHLSNTIIVTVASYDRPNHLTFVNGGVAEVTLDITLTPEGKGTELASRFSVNPHGFLRAIFPIFRSQMEKQEKLNMMNLKKAMEAPE